MSMHIYPMNNGLSHFSQESADSMFSIGKTKPIHLFANHLVQLCVSARGMTEHKHSCQLVHPVYMFSGYILLYFQVNNMLSIRKTIQQ